MAKVISIANQKGGVGKTTTTFNVGIALAELGKKVLLVDLDSQGNLTDYCKYDGDENHPTIADLVATIVARQTLTSEDMGMVICHNEYGVDYIPSSITLASQESGLMMMPFDRENVLNEILMAVPKEDYDYILVDCSPTLGVFLINALFASDGIVIPVQTQKFAKVGLTEFEKVVNSIGRKHNTELIGVIPTMTENTIVSNKTLEELKEKYGNKVMPEIKKRAEASKSAQKSMPIDRNTDIGQAYMEIAKMIVKGE